MDMAKLSQRQKLHVVEFTPTRNADSEGCVEILENLLEQAKRGEIVGVGISAVLANGCIRTGWYAGNRWQQLVASVSDLAFRLHDETR